MVGPYSVADEETTVGHADRNQESGAGAATRSIAAKQIAAVPRKSAARNVFINCPFDSDYQPLFYAAVFTVIDCGFEPRCALEIDDGSEVRIDKIFRIISECRLGIHDLSRTQLDKKQKLPRFNMPLELGIFLGAKRFGDVSQTRKSCLILDVKPYRNQVFVSDIAGQDIRAHGGDVPSLIRAIRDWLASASKRKTLPGGARIAARFRDFESALPDLCDRLGLAQSEMTFGDYLGIAATWLDERSD